MTVEELINALKKMPQSAKVTNENGYIVEEVETEPKEGEPGYWVWLTFSKYEID